MGQTGHVYAARAGYRKEISLATSGLAQYEGLFLWYSYTNGAVC